jgi:dephospho-CoA kinase
VYYLGRVVIISGWPGSGKTTVAKMLTEEGYINISVSDALRGDLIQKGLEAPTRKVMQDHGSALLQDHGSEWFANMLLARAMQHSRACIDGIRPYSVVEHIRKMSKHCLTIFLDADDATRAVRKHMRLDEYMQSISHPIEREVEEIRTMADLVICNNVTAKEVRKRILSAIFSWETSGSL